MAFRNEDQNFQWPRSPQGREHWPQRRASVEPDETKLSLSDTLRELTVTILGFVAVIALIIAAVDFFHG